MKSKNVFIGVFGATLAIPVACSVISGSWRADTVVAAEDDTLASGDIAIDASHFPDEEFRDYVKQFDRNKDDKLSSKERAAVNDISCPNRQIKSVKGLEYFTSVETLNVFWNELTELDVSKNTQLIDLDCSYNKIKKLDLTRNTELQSLLCAGTVEFGNGGEKDLSLGSLESIDVSKCEKLYTLDVGGNQLTKLDISRNPNLNTLNCNNNQLSSIDVRNQKILGELFCFGNPLTSLDVTKNTQLSSLIMNKTKIKSIDVSKCVSLDNLDVAYSLLTSLDLSENPHLRTLSTVDTPIRTLDISGTLINDVYDPSLLQDYGTYYAFYCKSAELPFALYFDKKTTIEYVQRPKIVCKIDEKTFPDALFREYVSQFDSDEDGSLSRTEVGTTIYIYIGLMENKWEPIKSVKGIEYFKNLLGVTLVNTEVEELILGEHKTLQNIWVNDTRSSDDGKPNGKLKKLDISGCPNLVSVGVSNNPLENVDLSNKPSLEKVDFSGCPIKKIDLSNSKKITDLDLSKTEIASLNLSANKAISELWIYDCPNLHSVDLSNLPRLQKLYCEWTPFSILDLSHNPELMDLSCGSIELKELDISSNTKLTYIYCLGGSIQKLDASHNPNLTEIILSGCEELQSLDISKNTKLEKLVAMSGQIKKLDVTNNPKLIEVDLSFNQLSSLDLSKNVNLKSLQVAHNELTSLDISKCTTLVERLEKYGVKENTEEGYFYSEISIYGYPNIYFSVDTKVDLKGYKLPRPTITPTPTQRPTGTPTPTKAPVKDPTFEDFVERLYTVALGRASEPEGKAFWIKQVVEEGKTGADCARFFLLDANEFMKRGLSVEDFVETLYETFFDRESDAAGKQGWVNAIKTGAKTHAEVVNDFIESTEWCDVCATYGVKSGAQWHKATKASKNAINFATRLYTCCLKREAEQGGLDYWSLALTNLEKTGAQAAQFFFEGDEFVGFNTSDREYLMRLYTTFMDREPSEEEIGFWTGEMKAGKQNRHSILAFFAQSPEFSGICKKYGIDRGEIG